MVFRFWVTGLSLLLLCSVSSAAAAPWEIDELMGKDAPQFTLSTMQGSRVSLSSLRGKVILLNFWATWCTSCKMEMPSFNNFSKAYKDRGLVVVGVAMDKSKQDVQNYLSKAPVEFPVLLDSDLSVSKTYRIFAFPTTFLIDRNGVLKEKYIGEEDWMSPAIRKSVEKYLK